ncbi:hypothetical protein OSB04_030412 [Centaurea solstitialis]|uniref:Uncharacterized protein n=1 Tax=Centaurea solstitialis TaxID=347529 RepID=A0AA38W4Y5_9ASTR|nr:hypothetical protein OSB04_030412 [Centaurea solstitialis]
MHYHRKFRVIALLPIDLQSFDGRKVSLIVIVFKLLFFLLQFEEQKDEVVVERILRVIFLNAERPTPVNCCIRALEKLKHQLAEAEAELELRKIPQVDTSPKIVGQGLTTDEW